MTAAGTTGRALLLAGHGSHLNERSGEAVRAQARRLAADGAWDEVLVGFWKEEPALVRALDGSTASDVTVVPVFMAEGYFTSEVIPAELGLDGPVTQREGCTLRLTPPVGVHPALADLIIERALEAGATGDDALFVLGHGTRRNAASGQAVRDQVERVRARGRFTEVAALYTDQDPTLAALPTLARGRRATVVPFFASDGFHVGELADEHASEPLAVRYSAPVGTHPTIATIIATLATEAEGR